jgi:hypothetical protein
MLRPVDERVDPVHELWLDSYGPVIAAQLDADLRYTLIEVGRSQFAFTDQRHYLRALGRAWDAGFVPKPLPSALGRELPQAAPQLSGVDVDLSDLRPADAEPKRRRPPLRPV